MFRMAAYIFAATVTVVVMFSTETRAGELSPELRRIIIEAGMAPWSGRPINLDDTLRGSRREKVTLRQFLGKPTIAYGYAQF